MFFVKSANHTSNEYAYPTVDVRFEATTEKESWALFEFFSNMVGKPVDPYEVKPEHTPLDEKQAALQHVPQLPDNTSTETKGQHE